MTYLVLQPSSENDSAVCLPSELHMVHQLPLQGPLSGRTQDLIPMDKRRRDVQTLTRRPPIILVRDESHRIPFYRLSRLSRPPFPESRDDLRSPQIPTDLPPVLYDNPFLKCPSASPCAHGHRVFYTSLTRAIPSASKSNKFTHTGKWQRLVRRGEGDRTASTQSSLYRSTAMVLDHRGGSLYRRDQHISTKGRWTFASARRKAA
jgi:hypothetical protein